MLLTSSSVVLLAFGLLSSAALPGFPETGPRPGQIKNLVTFGDSYTDVVSVVWFSINKAEKN